MKTRFAALVTLLCIIPAFLVPSSAYVELPFTIGTKITYYPFEGFGELSRTHMREAASVWNDAVGSTLISVSTTTQPNRSGYYAKDGKNYIYAEDVGDTYVAQNHYWWTNYKLEQSDININMYYSWANSAAPNCFDVYSVFLHELGHSIGLGDVETAGYKDKAIMYHLVYRNTERRELLSDDLDGLAELYNI